MVNEVFSDTEANLNSFVKAVRLLAALLVTLLFIPVPGEAQSRITPCDLAVKTNLAYDALGAPSLGMEIEVGRRWSVAATAAYKWGGTWAWKDQVHITTADISLNYWTKKTDRAVWQGLHVGPYVALYRYDFLFGSKGEQAKINWGAGVTCGYSLPVSRYFSFDFVIGLGYVGESTRSTRSAMTATAITYGLPTRCAIMWDLPNWRCRWYGMSVADALRCREEAHDEVASCFGSTMLRSDALLM